MPANRKEYWRAYHARNRERRNARAIRRRALRLAFGILRGKSVHRTRDPYVVRKLVEVLGITYREARILAATAPGERRLPPQDKVAESPVQSARRREPSAFRSLAPSDSAPFAETSDESHPP